MPWEAVIEWNQNSLSHKATKTPLSSLSKTALWVWLGSDCPEFRKQFLPKCVWLGENEWQCSAAGAAAGSKIIKCHYFINRVNVFKLSLNHQLLTK